MELWVRSQDKEILMKANRIDVDEKNIIVWDNDYHCGETYMGEYKTKERALEVLDDIQNIIRGKYATSFDYKTALKGFEKEDTQYMLEQMAVYEMPKE